MKRRLILILGIVMCLVLCVGCRGPAGLSEADRTAIRQNLATSAKLVNERDFKGAAALYAEDAIVLAPNQAAVQGRAAIQAWYEALPPISNFQLNSVETEGRGDLAYDRGTYSMTVTPAGASPIEDRGKYIAVWRKQADGSWKTLRDIWNSDLSLPAPEKPAAPAKKTAKKR
jgi:ketosteroid isomerase-like protein